MRLAVLNKLDLSPYSGFEFNSTVSDHCAIGVTYEYINGKETQVAGGLDSLGFENPAGGMLASGNDIAKLMQFMFRNNESIGSNNNQLFDGVTVNEMLVPNINLRNNYQTIGLPWEMQFVEFNTSEYNDGKTGVWFKSKQGELPGYRTSTAMVPSYKLGVFTASLTDDISDGTVWSYQILSMILPTLNDLLQGPTNTKRYTLPSNYKDLIGDYYLESEEDLSPVEIYVKNDSYLMVNAQELEGVFLRLELFHDKNGNAVSDVLRARDDVNGTNLEAECRSLEDGNDYELVYFDFDGVGSNGIESSSSSSHAKSFVFMGNKFIYTTKEKRKLGRFEGKRGNKPKSFRKYKGMFGRKRLS